VVIEIYRHGVLQKKKPTGWRAGSGSNGGKKTSERLEVYKKKLKWWEMKKNRKLYIGMDIVIFG